MKFNSLKIKMFLIFGIICIILFSCIYFLSIFQLNKIVHNNYKKIFSERINSVIGIIQTNNQKLNKTGFVEAYIHDFQNIAIKDVEKIYFKKEEDVLPVIIDKNSKILLDSDKNPEQEYFSKLDIVKSILNNQSSEIIEFVDEDKWYIMKRFKPWNWIIFYDIPLHKKYSDVLEYKRIQEKVLIILLIFISIIIFYSVNRITKPLYMLTKASKEMSDGNLDYDIDISGKDEISMMAESFKKMRDSIKDKMNRLTEKNNRLIDEMRLKENAILQLEETKEYVDNVFNFMPSILIGIDNEFNIIRVNKKAYNDKRMNIKQYIGRNIFKFTESIGFEDQTFINAIKNRKNTEFRKFKLKIGVLIEYFDIIIFSFGKHYNINTVIRLEDVNEQVKIQDMMIQTEKMMSVGGLAAGMAHEINNPLAGIISSVQNIKRRVFEDISSNLECADNFNVDLETFRKYLRERKVDFFLDGIYDSSIRASNIVSNMLDFSRKTNGNKTFVSINSLIEKTILLATNDYDLKKKYDFRFINIKKEFQDNVEIYCNNQEIEQVIFNIIKNAAQAMSFNAVEDPELLIKTIIMDENVIIKIKNNGPPIPEEIKNRIFEPFFTTKETGIGTGLGLSVSYFIITENHKGKISVSTDITGTEFTISLPLKKDEYEEKE